MSETMIIGEAITKPPGTSFLEILQALEEKGTIQWCWEIDDSGILKAFPLNYRDSGVTLSNLSLVRVTEKMGSVINSIDVYGAAEKSYPRDNHGIDDWYTEWPNGASITAWSTEIPDTSRAFDMHQYQPSYYNSAYSVRGYYIGIGNTGSTVDLILNENLNLLLFGNLCFSYKYMSSMPTDFDPNPLSLEVQFRKDSENYYSKTIETSLYAALEIRTDPEGNTTYIRESPWVNRFGSDLAIGMGGLGMVRGKWNRSGTVSWGDIASIRFILRQSPSNPSSMNLYLDNLTFRDGRYHGSAYDTTSIGEFGLEVGDPITNTSFLSDEECVAKAEMVITQKRDLETRIHLETKDTSAATIPSGYIVHFPESVSVPQGKTFSIREMDVTVEGLDLVVSMDLSSSPYFEPSAHLAKKLVESERAKRQHETRLDVIEEARGVSSEVPRVKTLYVGDDTEIACSSVTYQNSKVTTIMKGGGAISVSDIITILDLRQGGGGTAYAGLALDGSTIPVVEVTSTMTAYDGVLGMTISTRGWEAGRHTLALMLKSNTISVVAYNKLYEVYVAE